MKDLPDLALLGQIGARDASPVRAALAQTFGYRKTTPFRRARHARHARRARRARRTHRSPGRSYAAMAAEDALPWSTLEEVTAAARGFLDPVLASAGDGRWDPTTWSWSFT